MKFKNIPEDIKVKSIKEAQEEIKVIIQELESSDENIQDSIDKYKRMMQLNYHIQEEFKKKAKKINKTSLEKKSK
tara:strand:+ start:846 stop:1070 length:225 start_codon:yes stop_codon:yes gene_type:complete